MSATELLHGTSLAASLTVEDLEKSVAWYTNVLGWEIARRVERDGKLRAMGMKTGDITIMLNQDDFAKGKGRVKGAGMSFSIYTDQDVDRLAAQAKTHGGPLDTDVQDASWAPLRFFRVKDPDGFRWTIMKRLAQPSR